MNYNFIFFNFGADYYKPVYIPLEEKKNVYIHKYGLDSTKIINSLFFLHWSHKINKTCNIPLKIIWFKRMYANPFRNDKPICFVFLGGKYISESSQLRSFILQQNPDNKCIIYCGDLIAKKDWDVEKVKTQCDAIVTYDPGEAKKYGIYCFDKPIYGRIAPLTTPDSFVYDVYFLAFAKDRLPMIRSVHKRLTDAGLKCKFIICGVKNEDQLDDGIVYSDPIPYSENIEYVNKSKCILELIQDGSNTITLRAREAMVYKRKLLTNYIGIRNTDYFDSENMYAFSNLDDIDIDFIRSPINYDSFIDESVLAPTKLLDFFEEILKEKQ